MLKQLIYERYNFLRLFAFICVFLRLFTFLRGPDAFSVIPWDMLLFNVFYSHPEPGRSIALIIGGAQEALDAAPQHDLIFKFQFQKS